MSTLDCNAFWNQLERWMEGERSSDAQAHLRGCPNCRGVVNDLDSIRQTAHAMDDADVAPPDRIWASLRSQLEQEGLIHADRHGWAETVKGWFEEIFAVVPRPALAGAYLVALIAVGFALAAPGYRHSDGAQISTRPLTAQLNTDEEHAISFVTDSDPVVAASLRKNLAIVDNYIALCEKSVQEEPENEFARDYLYGAYQQKADLLAQMTERGDTR
ncbi:MAG TPA: hypothetical protein VEJ38_00035 [Candidatus Acidoferrales bacterium]|nr:hypothetical protein [Candidatus Acidoferrales bacterium]